ncbi:hypothetical protein HG530_013197 [Fusarium avenaceum]|nr:hypothetical protein HG530_013197 [Fusarium avenaceum]
MPTATGYFGYSVHNLGPLTTTFTAPSSCSTGTDHIVYASLTAEPVLFGAPTCGLVPFADCIPSGEKWDSVNGQSTTFVQGQFVYYSPGLACPSGWKTVWSLDRGNSGSTATSASGIASLSSLLSPISKNTGGQRPRLMQPTEVWKEVLEPEETLVYCCPSDYTADTFGNCISTLGPRSSFISTYSEICLIYAPIDLTQIGTLDGTTLTQDLLSIISGTGPVETVLTGAFLTESRPPNDLVIATYVPAVPLVYKQSDLDKAEKNDTGKGEEDGEGGDSGGSEQTSGSGGSESDENAASTMSRHGVVSVLGLAMGVLAGTGMLLAW